MCKATLHIHPTVIGNPTTKHSPSKKLFFRQTFFLHYQTKVLFTIHQPKNKRTPPQDKTNVNNKLAEVPYIIVICHLHDCKPPSSQGLLSPKTPILASHNK